LLLIDGKCIPSHYAHKIHSYVQGKKHRQYLQKQHDWDDKTWKNLDLLALKSAFLMLDPIKRISCSKRIHGWLNTGKQKSNKDITNSQSGTLLLKMQRTSRNTRAHSYMQTCKCPQDEVRAIADNEAEDQVNCRLQGSGPFG